MSLDVNQMPGLGFGLMRLPEKDGRIDLERVNKMVDAYLESGFNYFDTAYVYHGGNSERIVKETLTNRYPREKFTVATKLPVWVMNSAADRDRIFNEQLKRTGLEYFDYYLLHSIEDGGNCENYEKFDCFNWGLQKREAGLIKHFGFSYHGTPELLEKLLDRHPEIEFVQIQVNYADWENPIVHSGRLYKILRERRIPIIIMEPVKGGLLAKMDSRLEEKFRALRPDASIASWAMRFAASLEGVGTVLSGMSSEEQVYDNLKTFSDFEVLSQKEKDVIQEVVKIMTDMPLVPCTACRYCADGCPCNIKIPDIIRALNTKRLYPNEMRPHFFYNGLTEQGGKAKDCMECGQCESVCPQHLPVIELMKEAAEKFDRV